MNDDISTFQLMELFPDEIDARAYLEKRRWGDAPWCPRCSDERITTRGGDRVGYYRCGACSLEFTVRSGTLMDRSHVPLAGWLAALMYRDQSISDMARALDVTRNSAARLRDVLTAAPTALDAAVGKLVETVATPRGTPAPPKRYRVMRDPVLSVWSGMLSRCTNPRSSSYRNYGGRGITVCKRWRVFAHFRSDMSPRPPGTTLDRYPNNDGDYEPGNCRWISGGSTAAW
jgi:transposase-like protein